MHSFHKDIVYEETLSMLLKCRHIRVTYLWVCEDKLL